jgi:hypothetical protein
MKISQIAIYVPEIDIAKSELEEIFGFEFYEDILKMTGRTSRTISKSTIDLKLAFNHSMMDGVELEYINSSSSAHWHNSTGMNKDRPFLSHLGVYCETEEEMNSIIAKMALAGFQILQNTKSHGHSNCRPGDVIGQSSRCYKDVIFNSLDRFGFNLKLSLKAEL